METIPNPNCNFPPSGSFTFIDEFSIIYIIEWSTTLSGLDITTITQDPRTPGQASQGFKQGYALFRRGTITVDRQILVNTSDGYIIMSEGGNQEIGFFQSNFPSGPQPIDPFCYHLNNDVIDDIHILTICGPRWTDPDNNLDNMVSWGNVDIHGNIIPMSAQTFQFIDVWGNEDIESTCP